MSVSAVVESVAHSSSALALDTAAPASRPVSLAAQTAERRKRKQIEPDPAADDPAVFPFTAARAAAPLAAGAAPSIASLQSPLPSWLDPIPTLEPPDRKIDKNN